VDHKRTQLFDEHLKSNAKIVPFGGWDMPVSYTSVLLEHAQVRNSCGIFDVSHMGEIFVSGKGAFDFLQKVTINDVSRLNLGQGQYSALLNETGGMIDDLILYLIAPDMFLLCVNASNIEKDYNWLKKHCPASVSLKNESSAWSQIAIQGPKSREALSSFLEGKDIVEAQNLNYMNIFSVSMAGHEAYLARTGYTGELGFELYLPNAAVRDVWKKLLQLDFIQPIGLGARDTLRLEAGYLLYGNDMDESTSPIEAGIGWAVRLEKGDFLGRAVIEQQKRNGAPRKMMAFKLEDPGVPRAGMDIYLGDQVVGKVMSGSVLPTLGGAGGMALLLADSAKLGDKITVDVRGKRKLATVLKRPLYVSKTHD
jgi:aminomethyltransferase